MKKILIALCLFAVLCATSCVFSVNKEEYVKLPVEGKTFDTKPFKAILADGVFNIILAQGTKESVVVKGDLPKGLKIMNDGETLVITDTVKSNINTHTISTNIYITLVDITDMSVKLVGETSTKDTLKLKMLNFHSEGVGQTSLCLNTDSLVAKEEGVGRLVITGKAGYAKIDDNGVGELNAKEFKVDILHASVSGVGAAKVYASKELYLETSGVGGLQYGGPAKVMKSESSGVGKVEHVD